MSHQGSVKAWRSSEEAFRRCLSLLAAVFHPFESYLLMKITFRVEALISDVINRQAACKRRGKIFFSCSTCLRVEVISKNVNNILLLMSTLSNELLWEVTQDISQRDFLRLVFCWKLQEIPRIGPDKARMECQHCWLEETLQRKAMRRESINYRWISVKFSLFTWSNVWTLIELADTVFVLDLWESRSSRCWIIVQTLCLDY